MNINDIHDKYVLHIKMDFNKLRNNGFKIYGDHAYFNKFVYKDIDEIYFHIYNWDCGKNYELEEVIENVIATLDSLCTQKILWNIEKKRKKKHVQHNK